MSVIGNRKRGAKTSPRKTSVSKESKQKTLPKKEILQALVDEWIHTMLDLKSKLTTAKVAAQDDPELVKTIEKALEPPKPMYDIGLTEKMRQELCDILTCGEKGKTEDLTADRIVEKWDDLKHMLTKMQPDEWSHLLTIAPLFCMFELTQLFPKHREPCKIRDVITFARLLTNQFNRFQKAYSNCVSDQQTFDNYSQVKIHISSLLKSDGGVGVWEFLDKVEVWPGQEECEILFSRMFRIACRLLAVLIPGESFLIHFGDDFTKLSRSCWKLELEILHHFGPPNFLAEMLSASGGLAQLWFEALKHSKEKNRITLEEMAHCVAQKASDLNLRIDGKLLSETKFQSVIKQDLFGVVVTDLYPSHFSGLVKYLKSCEVTDALTTFPKFVTWIGSRVNAQVLEEKNAKNRAIANEKDGIDPCPSNLTPLEYYLAGKSYFSKGEWENAFRNLQEYRKAVLNQEKALESKSKQTTASNPLKQPNEDHHLWYLLVCRDRITAACRENMEILSDSWNPYIVLWNNWMKEHNIPTSYVQNVLEKKQEIEVMCLEPSADSNPTSSSSSSMDKIPSSSSATINSSTSSESDPTPSATSSSSFSIVIDSSESLASSNGQCQLEPSVSSNVGALGESSALVTSREMEEDILSDTSYEMVTS
jgi:hypothetical protein